jgi:hypothetical protein
MKRYTLRLTAQLEELVEARRVELGNDPMHLAYHADDVTTAYALTHIITQGMINARRGYAELGPVTGATTRTTKVLINPAFNQIIELLATRASLSTHATLRALIVAGASS